MVEKRSFIGSRSENQDLCRVLERAGRQVYILADGVGGARHGRFAVEVTVDCFERNFHKERTPEQLIAECLGEAKDILVKEGKNTGAAIVVACIEPFGNKYKMTYTWLGDSRLYLVTEWSWKLKKYRVAKDRKWHLSLMTEDDSVVFEYYLGGDVTLDALAAHPYKNLLSYAFNEDRSFKDLTLLKERIRSVTLSEGDRVFVCTDGVWEQMGSQKELLSYLVKNRISGLVEERVSASDEADNASYIMGILQNGCGEVGESNKAI